VPVPIAIGRGMVILLASYPRSGNTWFRILANALFGIKTADRYLPEGTLSEDKAKRSVELLAGQCPQSEVEAGHGVGFLKTHEMADEKDHRPAICLIRDGRDAYTSFAHLAMTSPGSPNIDFPTQLRGLVESTDVFGGWSRNVESWLGRKAPTVFLRYEDMLANPEKCLRETMAALGVEPPATNHKPPEFAELKKIMPDFFRKGRAGSWRDEMTPEIEDLFWVHHGATMIRLGYAR